MLNLWVSKGIEDAVKERLDLLKEKCWGVHSQLS